MTQLLVSVRSAVEALAALKGGADVIDVKEPRRGSLGAAESGVWRNVQEVVAGRAPVSAALGELLDGAESRAEQTAGLSYAKAGLSGCADRGDWQDHWRRWRARLAPGVRAVAVAYADWQSAAAPDPDLVIELGAARGCGALLVDTFDKRAGRLLDHVSLAQLKDWLDRARRLQMTTVVAGSLDLATLEKLLPLHPDLVAVRGALCGGSREGSISAVKVGQWSALL